MGRCSRPPSFLSKDLEGFVWLCLASSVPLLLASGHRDSRVTLPKFLCWFRRIGSSLKTPERVPRRSEGSFGFIFRSSSATSSSPGCTDILLTQKRRRKADDMSRRLLVSLLFYDDPSLPRRLESFVLSMFSPSKNAWSFVLFISFLF